MAFGTIGRHPGAQRLCSSNMVEALCSVWAFRMEGDSSLKILSHLMTQGQFVHVTHMLSYHSRGYLVALTVQLERGDAKSSGTWMGDVGCPGR